MSKQPIYKAVLTYHWSGLDQHKRSDLVERATTAMLMGMNLLIQWTAMGSYLNSYLRPDDDALRLVFVLNDRSTALRLKLSI